MQLCKDRVNVYCCCHAFRDKIL